MNEHIAVRNKTQYLKVGYHMENHPYSSSYISSLIECFIKICINYIFFFQSNNQYKNMRVKTSQYWETILKS